MGDRPPEPTPPRRQLDNEPSPLLTYEPESKGWRPALEGLPLWTRVLLLLGVGVSGYLAWRYLEPPTGSDGGGSVEPPPSAVAPLPDAAGTGGGAVTVAPLTAADTSVAPGSEVDVAVEVRDATGRSLSDMRVRFSVDAGAATLSEPEVWTDPSGVGRTTVGTSPTATRTVVFATVEGADAPAIRFTISSAGGAPARIVIVDGEGQEAGAGALLDERLEVEVQDADGGPVPGAEVRFEIVEGGGVAAPSRARTDVSGRASAIWRLGEAAGPQTLVASSPTLDAPVTFEATALGADVSEADPTSQPPAAAPDAPAGPVTVRQNPLAVGGASVCRIAGGGAVVCRGANDRGQTIEAEVTGARAVAAGLFHVCALDTAGVAECWGANDAGQLGDGSRTDRLVPVPLQTELRFSVIAAGVSHTCGLSGGGRPACWGANLSGQLGDGTRSDRAIPELVIGPGSFRSLVAGWNHTCGSTVTGDAYCWGLNRQGQVGDGSRLDRLAPQRIMGSVNDLAAGSAHTCAVSQTRVHCWGDNASGQLGDGTTETRLRPTPVEGLPGPAIMVTAGAAHTCVLLTDRTAHCWGQNLHGQLGTGTVEAALAPVPVSGGLQFDRIEAGGGLTCGLTADGAEYCWGLNQSGQLGDGSLNNRPLPTRVGGRQ